MSKKVFGILLICALCCAILLIGMFCFGNPRAGYGHVKKFGKVPEAFRPLVSQNRFHDTVASNGRLLEYKQVEESVLITERDVYGNEINKIALNEPSRDYSVDVAATKDGGFLVLYGFTDRFDPETQRWNYTNGVRSQLFKLNAAGEREGQYTFANMEHSALYRMFECSDGFLFFGHQGEQDKKRSDYNPATSVCATKLDKTGADAQTIVLGGSDFDMLDAVVPMEDGTYKLFVHAQSKDGDFERAQHLSKVYTEWEIILDEDLNVLSKQAFDDAGLRLFLGYQLKGYIDTQPVYNNDERLKPNTYPEWVRLVVDYGDFYLVVSEHAYAEYPNTPGVVSARWDLTETVYSAYDKSGALLWRDAVESSPDYDAMRKTFE